VLSRGSRQAIGLKALLARPESRLIVLDEPWEGLDPDFSRWLSETLREKRAAGVAVVLSSHRLHDLAGLCDRYCFLINGCITTMRPDDDFDGQITGERLLAMFDRLRGLHHVPPKAGIS
jgi:ABC-2 type transport system ATP-binding protein